MADICEKTRSIVFPWFDSTSTAMGLAKELVGLSEDENPHTFFELGCCHTIAGDLAAASASLREAIQHFQSSYDEMPARKWAIKERSLVEELLEAIADGTHAGLLSQVAR